MRNVTSTGPYIAPHDADFYESGTEQAFAWLQDEAPVHWCDPRPSYHRPYWIVSRWEDIRAVAANHQVFCHSQGVNFSAATVADQDVDVSALPDPRLAQPALWDLDPPEHQRYRRVALAAFTPKRVAAMERAIRRIVNEHLDSLDERGGGDFHQLVSAPVPADVVAELMGLRKEDRPTFIRWADIIPSQAEPDPPDVTGEFIEMFDYFEAEIADRRAHPRDDLITALIEAEVGGDKLTQLEILSFCYVLLLAGTSTTSQLLTGGALALAEHPDQRQRLVDDPGLIGSAVEELLRWVTPARYMGRTATRDTELRGQQIAEGDWVLQLYAAGNRDPRVYDDPWRFDVGRRWRPGQEQLSFGWGQHVCLGAALCRLEAKVIFEELLRRFPAYEIGGAVEHVPSTLLNITSRLPLTLRG